MKRAAPLFALAAGAAGALGAYACAGTSLPTRSLFDAGEPPAYEDGGGFSDAGECAPSAFAGSSCRTGTSCWKRCFPCSNKPETWETHDPIRFLCRAGQYASEGAVFCYSGRYTNDTCTSD